MISTPLRILAGVGIFAALAVVDFIQHGRDARRWREYLFLVLCVVVAMLYGVANDEVTSRISWEYFYYGKELAPIIGPRTPPNPAALDWQAARIGAAATWWAGLVIGVAILMANNPGHLHPQLPYMRLVARLPAIIGITALSAAILGLAGNRYWLNGASNFFQELAATNLWRPRHFMTVYGIHLGGYVGGAIATVFGVVGIIRERKNRQQAMVGK